MDMDWGNSDDDEAEDEAEAAFEEYQKMNKDAGFDEENIQFDSGKGFIVKTSVLLDTDIFI